jgi:hypothetical protein
MGYFFSGVIGITELFGQAGLFWGWVDKKWDIFFQELSGLWSYSGRQGYFGGGWIKNGIFFFRSYQDYGVIRAGRVILGVGG